MKLVLLVIIFSFWGCAIHSDDVSITGARITKLLTEDHFIDLNNWVIETPVNSNSKVYVKENKLVIDVAAGATIWFKKILSGNYLIQFKRKVIMDGGINDRLSDLNHFWMATDPKNPEVFGRTGVFEEYDNLNLYYAGVGGNTNKTTRFRKYYGDGNKPLIKEYLDNDHLLQPGKEYHVIIICKNGITEYYTDGKKYFSFKDEKPLLTGYFGFRTTASHQEIKDFKIYSIK